MRHFTLDDNETTCGPLRLVILQKTSPAVMKYGTEFQVPYFAVIADISNHLRVVPPRSPRHRESAFIHHPQGSLLVQIHCYRPVYYTSTNYEPCPPCK